jgi:hypothetical protein
MNKHIRIIASGGLLVLGSVLLVVGSGVSIAAPAAPPLAQAQPTPTPFSLDDLSLIQPGLGTVMLEYSRRMALAWNAEQAGNWDMAHYQILEMREIQETGEITRPPRAQALKSFESSFLDPVDAAISSRDTAQFQSAYRAAIQGCNSCHGSQTSADFPHDSASSRSRCLPLETLTASMSTAHSGPGTRVSRAEGRD